MDCLKKLLKTVRTTRRISELVRQRVPDRPRNRSSRPSTIDPRQISINSIDRLDFWPFSRLSSTQRRGDRHDRLDRLDSLYLPRFLADRTNGGAYATVARVASVAVCRRRQRIVDKRCVLEQN